MQINSHCKQVLDYYYIYSYYYGMLLHSQTWLEMFQIEKKIVLQENCILQSALSSVTLREIRRYIHK